MEDVERARRFRAGVAAVQVTAGQLVLVETDERAFADGVSKQAVILRAAAVQHAHMVRLA